MEIVANEIATLSTEALKICVEAAKGYSNRNACIQKITFALQHTFYRRYAIVRKLNPKHDLSKEELEGKLAFGSVIIDGIAVGISVFYCGIIESYNCAKPKHLSYTSTVRTAFKAFSRFQQLKHRWFPKPNDMYFRVSFPPRNRSQIYDDTKIANIRDSPASLKIDLANYATAQRVVRP